MIRPLQLPGDRAELWRMQRLLHPTLAPEEQEAEMAGLDELLGSGRYAVFVHQRDDGRLGGFVEVGERDYAEGCSTRPVAFLEAWFTDEDLRRQRVGAALVDHALEWARARGLREMGSDTLVDNQVSIRAHQALGFATVETQVCFLKKL
jgi:aminoglycoside 6'-N-acetyltransferase I